MNHNRELDDFVRETLNNLPYGVYTKEQVKRMVNLQGGHFTDVIKRVMEKSKFDKHIVVGTQLIIITYKR